MAQYLNAIRTTAKNFLKPKLVKHIPGEKRVYQNFLGTKTEFTLEKANDIVALGFPKGGHLESLRIHGLPEDMYIGSNRHGATVSNNIPVVDTMFTKAKTYLFGLFKGKTKQMETINVNNRAVLRGSRQSSRVADYDYSRSGLVKDGMGGGEHGVTVTIYTNDMNGGFTKIKK